MTEGGDIRTAGRSLADPELGAVVTAWPTLPEAVRLAIVGLVDGAIAPVPVVKRIVRCPECRSHVIRRNCTRGTIRYFRCLNPQCGVSFKLVGDVPASRVHSLERTP